jgi:hypothetical protein
MVSTSFSREFLVDTSSSLPSISSFSLLMSDCCFCVVKMVLKPKALHRRGGSDPSTYRNNDNALY